ncbi:von willebrand factor type D domain-containing protein [Phthorimaea operculella]|nr:von willebrand factor type D domain-containing protein [Phthorimaea operculella]
MAPSIARYKAAIKTELRWFTTTAAMIGREDREDALLKSALQADERVRVVSEHLTECLMLLEEAPNPEDKELVEGDVSQCLELAQDIAQAAADISRRRDGKEKPFRGKVGQGLQVPLPPVTVPVFAGDYADWPAFEDLYSSVVHTRTDITPAYKMAQLMSRLHGEPHELLTHLAVSDSNYEVAWKILTDRYRNKRLIVDRLASPPAERNGRSIRAATWGKSSDHLPTYEDLKSFLEAESRRVDVQAGEAPRKETSAPRHPERPGAPARGGNSGQPRRYNTALESGCAYCRRQATGWQRVRSLLRSGFRGDGVWHSRGVGVFGAWGRIRCECPSSTNCRYCQGAHHPLLCMNRSGGAGAALDRISEGPAHQGGSNAPHPSKEEPTSASVTGTGRGTSTDGAHLPKDVGTIPTTAAGAGLGKSGTGTWPRTPIPGTGFNGRVSGGTRQPPGYMQYSAGLSHLVGSQDPRMPRLCLSTRGYRRNLGTDVCRRGTIELQPWPLWADLLPAGVGPIHSLETSGPTRRDPVLYGSVLSEVLQRFWESEEPPTADRRKPEDDECELFYQYNTARCPSGRFVTRLPFLPNRPALDISYHVIGRIIDTRSARFDAWRDYDDVTTVDLASYIRLNHSRLLTSSIVWRPQIFGQVKAQAVYTVKLLYGQLNDTLVIIKEAPMEAHLALKNIWTDAKPRLRDFLDDLNEMHVIKDDLDEFERFLNESYDNNDFYVKDIVEFTFYVLDEMAIRNHMENLPGLVNDMWGMMGNTSKSIKDSITFVMNSIKTAYNEFLEGVNKVLDADIMELVSDKLESMILQYDTFVRDWHMRFLEYWEDTWKVLYITELVSDKLESMILQYDTFVRDWHMRFLEYWEDTWKVLDADIMELVSDKLESMILQYDTFVRDWHMRFLEYWEDTWVSATTKLWQSWQEILKSIEPLFYKVLHYTEGFVAAVGKNMMDFFMDRTNELTKSKYFNYVAAFGQEMDKIYKDLVNNDLFTNIKKYSTKLWNVLWGKIEKYIPFKEEFIQLYREFKNTWQTFLQIEQVVYVREKCKEAYVRLKWWYDYFLIGEAFEEVWNILYAKVTDMAKTALQYEELHRTPKTNFIFDPRKGEILLEQKLPMSWHAFNRTPDFTEIAEYRAVHDFLEQWLTTNKSLWSYYYEIKPYLDLDNILPPFAGMAMMTGQGTLVTFDKRVITISEAGTFLLSKDYRQNNFTVLMESNAQGRYNLLVLTKKNLVHIDLYKEEVSIEGKSLSLPTVVGDFLLDRQTDTLTVQGENGLDIQCNMLFRTCRLQVSGWYYANLGGLLGTYNNEQCDDLQLPNSTYTESVGSMAHAWNIEPTDLPPLDNKETNNDTQCEKFFRNKVSPLHPCFSVSVCSMAHAWNIEPTDLPPLDNKETNNDTQCEKFFQNKVSPLHPCFSVSVGSMAHAWNIEPTDLPPLDNKETNNDTQCEKFFQNKVSPLHPCFSVSVVLMAHAWNIEPADLPPLDNKETNNDTQCEKFFQNKVSPLHPCFSVSVSSMAHAWNIEPTDLPPLDNKETNNDTQCEKFFQNKVSPLHPCFSVSAGLMAHAWNIEPTDLPPLDNKEANNDTQCEKFFQNKVSPLHPCFSVINAKPFFAECVLGVDACALASAYLELCSMQHVPVHIPDHCVQCTTPQGEVIEEGSFYQLQHVPNSTDVVFIVEAQYCNKNIRKNKNLDLFIEAFDIKLQASGLSDNRYAVVGFGEKSDLVRSNRTAKADMFAALSYATQLAFRAGVTRTLLLIPCTRCDSSFMRADMFAALSYATQLSFRAGVTRTLLLIPCTRCDSSFMRLSKADMFAALSYATQLAFRAGVTRTLLLIPCTRCDSSFMRLSKADMFAALSYATQLAFRAGVTRTLLLIPCTRCDSSFMRLSKADMFALTFRAGVTRTLLLIPCTRCDSSFMRLDYSTIHHNLMENSVTLHILMDQELAYKGKKRNSKNLFGIDHTAVYSNKDYERLNGDAALLKQVKFPKEKLGVCSSLAIETNGSIFAGPKLQGERSVARRFSTVVGARVAQSAKPCSVPPRCECREARLHCRPCQDNLRLMDLPFWDPNEIDELIDLSMDNPTMPSFR